MKANKISSLPATVEFGSEVLIAQKLGDFLFSVKLYDKLFGDGLVSEKQFKSEDHAIEFANEMVDFNNIAYD